MARLRSIGFMRQTGQKGFLKAYIGQLFQPIGTQLVQFIREHLLIIRQHIMIGNPLSQLPDHPFHKPCRHGLIQITACLRYRCQISHLLLQIQLPDISLQRMANLGSVHPDTTVPRKKLPFLLWHKLKQEFIDLRSSHIQKMTAANIERAAVHHHRTAQTARFFLFLQEQKISFTQFF